MCLTVSLVVFTIIVVLIISEVRYYSSKRLSYDYDVDPHFDGYHMAFLLLDVMLITSEVTLLTSLPIFRCDVMSS